MKGKKQKSKLRRVILVSIGVLLLSASFIGYNMEKKRKSPDGIFARYYETFPNTYFKTSEGGEDVMNKAFLFYEKGQYVQAAELLEERIKTSSAVELKFYRGLCYLEMGNYPLALKDLENIKRFSSDIIDETYWYLGMIYLKQKNYSAARSHFQDFIELTNDQEKRKEAIAIVKII